MPSWVATAERRVRERIPGPPEQVREFYVDLDRIAQVHPLVVAVTSTGRTDTADGYIQTYQVADRIPFGPISLPIRYRVRLSVPRSGEVRAQSWQFPRVHLDTTVSFAADGNATVLTETMRISAPRPLLGVTVRQGVAAHQEMLARIAQLFSGV
jgi:hypothetical protein